MSTPIPVLNRFFRVEIQDLPKGGPEVFYSIRGLNAPAIHTMKTYSPGGFDQTFDLPIPSQGGTLVLKRPLIKEKTGLTKWCEEGLKTLDFKPTIAQILVLNRNEEIIAGWSVEGIYPVGLESSSLGLEQGNGVIEETITLAYASLTRT